MNPKAELMAATRSGGLGLLSTPQGNSKPSVSPLMPTQGPTSSPGTAQRPPSHVQYLRGALSEKRKLGV